MNETEQYIAALLWELYGTKQLNRELLRKNTNLTIENAKLKVRLEMNQAFADRKRGNKNDNQC